MSSSEAIDVFSEFSEVAFRGCRFVLPARDHITECLVAGFGYEAYVMDYLCSFVRTDTVFLDVGANVGLFSLPVASMAPDGLILSVEASQRNAKLILRNAALNGLKNVKVIPIGADSSVGANIVMRQSFTTNNQLLDAAPLAQEPFDRFDVVGVAPLDSLIDHSLHIALMKIDIEGREYRALLGAKRILEEHRPAIFCEYHPSAQKDASGVEGADLIRLIHEAGYGFEILHRSRPREFVDGNLTSIIKKIDDEHSKHRRDDGGTHLDLCLLPL
jgi:FkbM family methyltransferase